MKNKYYLNGFHSVSPSPWPFLMSVSVFSTAVGFVLYVNKNVPFLLFAGLGSIFTIFSLWCQCIVREATYQGAHTLRVIYTLKFGFLMFVLSEAMFFSSFFWAYLHAGLSPAPEIGVMWPPAGVQAISPLGLPLVNTVILVWSGCWVTASHHHVKSGNREKAMETLNYTYLLGILFTIIQYYEFRWCTYTIADSVYGCSFFILTGFHGVHVIVGTIFLVVCYYRMKYGHFTQNRHLGFECAIIYWHFVDVIWIVVYILVYGWGYFKF